MAVEQLAQAGAVAGQDAVADPGVLPAAGPGAAGCQVTGDDAGRLLTLAGRLDVHSAADVRLALVEAVGRGTSELVVDVAGVTAVDATGLGVLVAAHRRAGRAGRVLVLRDVPAPLRRLLLLTRLDRVLRTCHS